MPSLFLTVLHDAICNRQTILVVASNKDRIWAQADENLQLYCSQTEYYQSRSHKKTPAKKFLTAKKFDSKLE